MKLRNLLRALFVPLLLAPSAASAENSFDGITCQSDIASALAGRRMPNDRVVAIEARYKSIGLNDLGAFGMEPDGDPWTLISWQICGSEYVLLERENIVRDVLKSPLPPGSPPSRIATCSVDGEKLEGTSIVFIEGVKTVWPKNIEWAWVVDDKVVKFNRIEGKEIACVH